jgi:cysteine desulfurase / selenocysteine lyase
MTPFLPADVRSHFPGAQDKVYLNIAETGLMPLASAAAARAFVEHAVMGSGDKAAYRESVEGCREGLALLLGAHPDEVAITKNVSEALNLVASSLPWKAGDNVVRAPAQGCALD